MEGDDGRHNSLFTYVPVVSKPCQCIVGFRLTCMAFSALIAHRNCSPCSGCCVGYPLCLWSMYRSSTSDIR